MSRRDAAFDRRPIRIPIGADSGSPTPPAWSPSSLPSLAGWYRADTGITLAGADVDSWADLSSRGNTLAAPAAGNRPLFVATGFNGGSQPYVELDGVGEYLRRAVFDWGGSVGPFSVFMVAQNNAAGGNRLLFGYGGGSRPTFQHTTNTLAMYSNGAATALLAAGDFTSGGAAILAGETWDLAEVKSYRSATLRNTTASAAAALANNGALGLGGSQGGTSLSSIRVAEFILMNALISGGDLTQLAAYTSARYGVS